MTHEERMSRAGQALYRDLMGARRRIRLVGERVYVLRLGDAVRIALEHLDRAERAAIQHRNEAQH